VNSKAIILLETQVYQHLTIFDYLSTMDDFTLYIEQETYERYEQLQNQKMEQEDWSLICLFGLSKYTNRFSIEPFVAPLEETLLKKMIKQHGEVTGVYATASYILKLPKEFEDIKNLKIGQLKNGLLNFERPTATKKSNYKEAFFVKKTINKIEIENLSTVYSPRYGFLYFKKDELISSSTNKGGEGIVKNTFHNLTVKLFFKEKQKYLMLKKLQAMLSMDIYHPAIIWPKDLVYHEDAFVGYAMKTVRNAVRLDFIFNNPGDVEYSKYVDMYPVSRMRLAIALLKAFDYLHQRDILVGDLKDSNIFVRNPDTVFIIDSGSFQILDYGSNVLTPEWKDRDIQSLDHSKYLIEKSDEYYPIYKMIFRVLFVDKSPHFQHGVSIEDEDYQNYIFSTPPTDAKYIYQKMYRVYDDTIKDIFKLFFEDGQRKVFPLQDIIAIFTKELERLKSRYPDKN
jgi:hypothetical protein